MDKKLILSLSRIMEVILIIMGVIIPFLLVEENPLPYQLLLVILIYSILMIFRIYRIRNYLINKEDCLLNEGEKGSLWDFMFAFKSILASNRAQVFEYEKINHTLQLAIEINQLALIATDTNELYEMVLKKAIEAVEKSDKGSILLVNDKDELEFKALVGFDHSFFDFTIPIEEAFLFKLTNGAMDKSVIVENVVDFNQKHMSEDEFNRFYENYPKDYFSTITAPIRNGESFLGVINLDSNDLTGFTEDDLHIMDLFASQLDVIIENRNLIINNKYLSRYDKLTNALNRSYFDEVIDKRLEKEDFFSFVVMDIDNLKKVNDQYGHQQGDSYLKCFSSAVHQNIRVTDVFARIGGDEFVLILYYMLGDEVEAVIQRINSQLEIESHLRKLPMKASFSYGITEYPNEANSYETLYGSSDARMYDMKRKYKSTEKEEHSNEYN